MARIRQLKPDFFLHEGLGSLSRDHRLMFAGLWCHADREGRLEDRPLRLSMQIFPYDKDLDRVACETMLRELEGVGCIVRYEVSGRRFIAIPSWPRHQHPHIREPPSVIPPPSEIKPSAGPVLEPGQHQSGPVLALFQHQSSPADSGVRINTSPKPPSNLDRVSGDPVNPVGAVTKRDPGSRNVTAGHKPTSEELYLRLQQEDAFELVLKHLLIHWRNASGRPDALISKRLRGKIWDRFAEGRLGQQMTQAIDGYCYSRRGRDLGPGLTRIFWTGERFESYQYAERPAAVRLDEPIRLPEPGSFRDALEGLQVRGMSEMTIRMLLNLEVSEDSPERLLLRGDAFTCDQVAARGLPDAMSVVIGKPVELAVGPRPFRNEQGVTSHDAPSGMPLAGVSCENFAQGLA